MEDIQINWFPGHMAKAQRMIRENLKLVDVVIELLDARIPLSSANPLINEIIENKPRVVALNKADLAEEYWTKRWAAQFRSNGLQVVPLDAVSGKGTKQLVNKVEQIASGKMAALAAKGIKSRAVRVMILGIPNVGKSSLINRLLGSAALRTADKPGVTRGKQWIKIGKSLELLDTPGVLWPKLQDMDVAFKLAITGAINDEVYDLEKVMFKFLALLRNDYPEQIINRFKLNSPLPEEPLELLRAIGAKRGCLKIGGIIDEDKAMRIILNEFRGGKLGQITLDHIDSPNKCNQ